MLLVSESPGVAEMAVPSKLTSFARSRKAIFAATDATGFTAGEIAASGARVCVPADWPDLLLPVGIRLGTDHDLGVQLGEAGRRYCASSWSADAALNRCERWIINVADTRRTRNGTEGRRERR